MSGDSFEVPPLSRAQIRTTSRQVRDLWHVLSGAADNTMYFDVVSFLDIQIPKTWPEFVLEVVPVAQMRSWYGEAHAMTIPTDDLIQVREDIWDRAVAGEGRDRFTLVHELGHYVLHGKPGFGRRLADSGTVTYRTSEWQADAFAGELLMPSHLVRGCSGPNQLAEMCGVSLQAATVQWTVFKRDQLV